MKNYRIEKIELSNGADLLCQAAPELLTTGLQAVAAIGAGEPGDIPAQEFATMAKIDLTEIEGQILAGWKLPKPYRLPDNSTVTAIGALFDPFNASCEVFFV